MVGISRVNFAIRLDVGHRQVVFGQIDTRDTAELFILRGWWSESEPLVLQVPIVGAEPLKFLPARGNYCRLCGEKPSENARFCGGCGTTLEPKVGQAHDTMSFREKVMSLARQTVRIQNEGSDPAAGIQELRVLLLSVARSNLAEQTVADETHEQFSSLLSSLEALFVRGEGRITAIVDGILPQPAFSLSLALAQEIGRKADHALAFTPEEEVGLRILLTKAPLTYGYWSPFKRVLKSINPTRYPAEFATASFRLSNPWRHGVVDWGEKAQWEDVSLIAQLGPVAGPKTREYLRRQQLREYRRVAESDPGQFVQLATHYLLASESRPSHPDIIEAFILMGGGVFRDQWSRKAVSMCADQKFTPPATSGWNEHPDLLMRLWTSVTRRAEFQSFAFQSLRARGAILSELTANQLGLALRSQFEPLVAYAAEEVIRRPETWKSQSDSVWSAVLSRADKHSRELLLEHALFPLSAIQQVLELDDEELASKAISVFLERFPEWDEAGCSLRDSLWVQLLMKADV